MNAINVNPRAMIARVGAALAAFGVIGQNVLVLW